MHNVTIDSEDEPDHYEWPNREEWAERQRTMYCDMEEWVKCSTQLADYATPEEIETARQELEEKWRALGRELQAANKVLGPLCRQPGETQSAYIARYLAMSDENQTCLAESGSLQHERREIRKWLREMAEGYVPMINQFDEAPSLLVTTKERYDAAWETAKEALAAKIAQTPIDDEAWAAELARRAEIDNRTKNLRVDPLNFLCGDLSKAYGRRTLNSFNLTESRSPTSSCVLSHTSF